MAISDPDLGIPPWRWWETLALAVDEWSHPRCSWVVVVFLGGFLSHKKQLIVDDFFRGFPFRGGCFFWGALLKRTSDEWGTSFPRFGVPNAEMTHWDWVNFPPVIPVIPPWNYQHLENMLNSWVDPGMRLECLFFRLGWCCSPKPTDRDKVTQLFEKILWDLRRSHETKIHCINLNYIFGMSNVALLVTICDLQGKDAAGNLWNVMPSNIFDIYGILGCRCCYFFDEVWSLPTWLESSLTLCRKCTPHFLVGKFGAYQLLTPCPHNLATAWQTPPPWTRWTNTVMSQTTCAVLELLLYTLKIETYLHSFNNSWRYHMFFIICTVFATYIIYIYTHT